jgi:hypothetical protein
MLELQVKTEKVHLLMDLVERGELHGLVTSHADGLFIGLGASHTSDSNPADRHPRSN